MTDKGICERAGCEIVALGWVPGSSLGSVVLMRRSGTFRQRKAGHIDFRVGGSTRTARDKSACGFSDSAEHGLLKGERKGGNRLQ